MTPIPGEPHAAQPQELTMSDGRKVKLKVPGLTAPPAQPQQREGAEPPDDDQEPAPDPD